MTEPTATPPAGPPAGEGKERPDGLMIAGTIIMGLALAAAAVILLDVAVNGRLLAPVFARVPMRPGPPVVAPDDLPDAAPVDVADPAAGE
jgi:hypothetical protein